MALRLYVDMMSQPCRALVMFMKMSKIPFQPVPVAIRKGEHKQDEYLAINPLGKVPTLVDNDFVLTERYLAEKYPIPEHLYPKDIQKRAKVDEYLAWQHLNARFLSAKVFLREVIFRKDVSNDVKDMNTMLDQLEMMFLKDKPFLIGDQLSFADILAVNELMQPTMSGRDVFEGRPELRRWFERVQESSQPHFNDAFTIFNRSKESILKRSKM